MTITLIKKQGRGCGATRLALAMARDSMANHVLDEYTKNGYYLVDAKNTQYDSRSKRYIKGDHNIEILAAVYGGDIVVVLTDNTNEYDNLADYIYILYSKKSKEFEETAERMKGKY